MKKRILSLFITLLMIVSLIAPSSVQAATIKLNKTKVTIYEGETYQLKLSNYKKTVKWSTSNANVATVDKSGNITAHNQGTVYITTKVNNKTYKCYVTVKFDKKEAAKNVSFERHDTKFGIITIVTNNNTTPIAVIDNFTFYSNDIVIQTEEEETRLIAPNSSYAYCVYYPTVSAENISYTNDIKVKKYSYKDLSDSIEIKTEMQDGFMTIRASNKGYKVQFIFVSFIYYKNGEIVGFDNTSPRVNNKNSVDTLSRGTPVIIDDNDNLIYPDSYKIFVQAYGN